MPGKKVTTKGPIVAEVFHWPDAPTDEFLEFIETARKPTFSGSTAISKHPHDQNGVPQAFVDHCKDVFEKMNYPVQEVRYWYGVTLPRHGNKHYPRFAKGFPHAHNWNALTLIHYVQLAEIGGDLVQVDEDHKTINRFVPEVGMTVVVDGYSLHGIELVEGETPRMVLICTGFHVDQDLTRGAQQRGAA